MMMQILHAGGTPISSDNSSRPADWHNPKGYYELEGGKIVNKLMDGTFPLEKYKGTFIKITAYGLQFLPKGNYKIIYSERNLEETLDSMEKMAGVVDENRDETQGAFRMLNEATKKQISKREDMDVLLVQYNEILAHPKSSIENISKFLGIPTLDQQKMLGVIDKNLYRQRRIS